MAVRAYGRTEMHARSEPRRLLPCLLAAVSVTCACRSPQRAGAAAISSDARPGPGAPVVGWPGRSDRQSGALRQLLRVRVVRPDGRVGRRTLWWCRRRCGCKVTGRLCPPIDASQLPLELKLAQGHAHLTCSCPLSEHDMMKANKGAIDQRRRNAKLRDPLQPVSVRADPETVSSKKLPHLFA